MLSRAGDQGVGLVVVEVADDGSIAAFGGDVEHSGDERGVLGVAQGGEAEEAADGGQAGVAGADAVVAFGLEVVEEVADQLGVEVGQVELVGLLAAALLARSPTAAARRRGRRRRCWGWPGVGG